MLTNEQIKRFQEIWARLFGEEISEEEADKEGGRLARVVRLIGESGKEDKSLNQMSPGG